MTVGADYMQSYNQNNLPFFIRHIDNKSIKHLSSFL